MFFMQERLDRALANSVWIDNFPRYNVEVVAACNSDHLPLLITLECPPTNFINRPKVFRYAAGWGKK